MVKETKSRRDRWTAGEQNQNDHPSRMGLISLMAQPDPDDKETVSKPWVMKHRGTGGGPEATASEFRGNKRAPFVSPQPFPKLLPERMAGSEPHLTSRHLCMSSGPPNQTGRRERSTISTPARFLKQFLSRRVTFNRAFGRR